MANLEPAKELLVKTAKNLSAPIMQKAAKEIVPANSAFDLSNLKIPFVTSDPAVEEIIDEFQLRDPEKMIRFLVEAHFSAFDSIREGIYDLNEIDMINSVSFVGGAKRSFKRAIANPQSKNDQLNKVSSDLDRGLEQLQDKAFFYIEKIRAIDNQPRVKFFFKGKDSGIKAVDSHNHCAKAAVKAVIEAVNLQSAIAAELGWDIDSSVIIPFEDFKHRLLGGDNCSLMHAYDDEAESEFWLKLPQMLEEALDTADTLQNFLDSTEAGDFDFDNIEYN